MAITGHSSGNLNDVRAYPFADTADRVADGDAFLPDSVLNDCHVWWPDTYGNRGFLSSATVSPSLITFTFAAWNDVSGDVTPIAAVQVIRPYVPYRSYPMVALQPGVAGWAAAGTVPEEWTSGVRTWLFSEPERSELLPRLAQAYPSLPVTSLSKEGSPLSLTERVLLLAGSNISIEEGLRYIDGILTRCVVFSLADDGLPENYRLFAGPCGGRPESDSCDRTPIRRINGVEPDCNGLIYVEVDDTNSVIVGSVDVSTVEDGGGLILTTPIEYADVCNALTALPPLAEDYCEIQSSSSSAPPVEESSSSGAPPESSSSAQPPSIVYEFDDAVELRDWSYFERNDDHVIDWDARPSVTLEYDEDPRLLDGNLVLIASETVSQENIALNNAWKSPLSAVGSSVEWTLEWEIDWADIMALLIDELDSRTLRLILHDELSDYYFELFLRHFQDPDGLMLAVAANYRDDSFSAGGSGPDNFIYVRPIGSSSSAGVDYARIGFSATLRLTRSTVDSCAYELSLESEGVVASGTFSGLSSTLFDAPFVSLNASSNIVGSSGPTSPSFRFRVKRLAWQADTLAAQGCDELDLAQGGDTVAYALEYLPDGGWSNDFGTTRAVNQFALSTDELSVFETQDYSVDEDGLIRTGQQYLEMLSGIDHKYALLQCDNSVVSDPGAPSGYVFSTAFRMISGDPRVGLVLGYQDGDDRDVFWAVAVDLTRRLISYGIHYKTSGPGHFFQPSGWVFIPGTDTGWPFAWHRLVVRVTFGGGSYGISAWLDPLAPGSSSSGGALNLLKTIPVNYAEPLYVVARTPWTGSLGLGPLQFADGRSGVYVFGGDARIAEFTASPVNEDIVVANKVPWLGV